MTIDDFKQTKFDSTAKSVILFTKTKYEALGSFVGTTMTYHIRTKIIDKNFNPWGDFILGDKNSFATKIKAAVYRLEDGKIVTDEIKKEDIIVDKGSGEKVFALPNLRDGCIVEHSFTITYEAYFFINWKIQTTTPTLWSEFLNNNGFTYVIEGNITPFLYDEKFKDQGLFHRWVFKDIPAIKLEPNVRDTVDCFPKIKFSIPGKSWEEIIRKHISHYEEKHNKFVFRAVERDLDDLIESNKDQLLLLKAISNYVKENYKFNEYRDFSADNFDEIHNRKTGTSGDLNSLLYYLLQRAKLNPQFVFLSSHGNGRVNKLLYYLDQFDYVLCRVVIDGKEYFIDATDKNLPFDIIPKYCLVEDALLVEGKLFRWITIPNISVSKTNVNARLSVTNNQTLKGSVRIAKQGYIGHEWRNESEKKGVEHFKKSATPNPTWNIDSVQVLNNDRTDLPFIATFFSEITDMVTVASDKLYINPYILLSQGKNIWNNPHRSFPLSLELSEETLLVTLTIPNGYKLDNIPETMSYSLPDKSLSCTFKFSVDKERIVITYSKVVRKSLFETNEYGGLRELASFITSKQNELLVLSKI